MEEIEDIIEEISKEARKNKLLSFESIEDEIERTKEYKKVLNYKKQQIEKAKLGKVQIPSGFKKVEDIIKEEKDLRKFYYNLFFYDLVDYKEGIGYLIKDNKDFYLKFITYTDNFPLFDDYKEELCITEETARQVLKYDEIVAEMEKQAMEESE